MHQQFRFILHLLFPLLALWLESQLAIDRDWSALAIVLRALPLAIAVAAEQEWLSQYKTRTAKTLALVGTLGFLMPLIVGQNDILECVGFYSMLAALGLWRTEQNIENTHVEKSLWRGLITICVGLLIVYVTIHANSWNGLYTDLDIARTAFVFIGVALPLMYAIESAMKWNALHKQTVVYAVACSLATAFYFSSWNIVRFENSTTELSAWIFGSILATHGLFFVALLKPIFPDEVWADRAIRFPSYIISAVAIAFFGLLFSIAVRLEFNSEPKGRPKGVFEKTAAHLRNHENREVSSTSDPDEKMDLSKLRVLNLNAWLVEGWVPQFIIGTSRDLEERVALMPEALAEYDADIIFFQEVWKKKRRKEIAKKMQKYGYKYSVHGSDSFWAHFGFGNGLLIVSRLPLDKPQFKTFNDETIADEESFFSRKGILKTRVNVESITGEPQWVDLYTSHLDRADKVEQSKELGDFIQATRSSPSMLLAVDLNTPPTSSEYRSFASIGLKDPVVELYPKEEATEFTFDPATNYYAKTEFAGEEPGRIDYILSGGETLRPISSERVLTDFALSDHFGLLTVFQVTRVGY